jgi:hypothetical protein
MTRYVSIAAQIQGAGLAGAAIGKRSLSHFVTIAGFLVTAENRVH